MKKLALTLVLGIRLAAGADSLLDPGNADLCGPRPLVPGQLITVVIVDQVNTNQSVTVKNDTAKTMSGPTGTGLLSFLLPFGVSNKGSEARTQQAQTSSSFQNTVTARIVAVEPGNVL